MILMTMVVMAIISEVCQVCIDILFNLSLKGFSLILEGMLSETGCGQNVG